jgi:hypothetical protein
MLAVQTLESEEDVELINFDDEGDAAYQQRMLARVVEDENSPTPADLDNFVSSLVALKRNNEPPQTQQSPAYRSGIPYGFPYVPRNNQVPTAVIGKNFFYPSYVLRQRAGPAASPNPLSPYSTPIPYSPIGYHFLPRRYPMTYDPSFYNSGIPARFQPAVPFENPTDSSLSDAEALVVLNRLRADFINGQQRTLISSILNSVLNRFGSIPSLTPSQVLQIFGGNTSILTSYVNALTSYFESILGITMTSSSSSSSSSSATTSSSATSSSATSSSATSSSATSSTSATTTATTTATSSATTTATATTTAG